MSKPATSPRPTIEDFLASHGGPFHELLHRLRLMRNHALMAGQRAALFIAAAWLVPLLLAILGNGAVDLAAGREYLADPRAWARFFVAVGAFILAEQQVENSLGQTLRRALSAPIIAPSSIRDAAEAVNRALRRRKSPTAEAICLGLAGLAALLALRHQYTVLESAWSVTASPNGNSLTVAGWWSILVSIPIFWFLVLRGLWRHLIWSLLIRKVARLELKLVATHPDKRGGIGFLAEYPNAYVSFVFGMSCAVSTGVGSILVDSAASIQTIGFLMAGWLVLVLALFAYPLSAFSAPLAELKRRALASLDAQATRYHRMTERKLVGANAVSNNPGEADDADGDLGDPTKPYESAKKLSTLMFDRKALLPVSAAALLPFAVLASTRVPIKEILSLLKKLLLL